MLHHVDPENLGLSTLHWWPQVCDLHKRDNLSIPDIYQLYRSFVQQDMVQSKRIQLLGVCDHVHDMLFYCFRAGLVSPPPHTTDLLCKLHREDHSIVWDTDDEQNAVIKIHPWPSWLRRGTLRTITSFFDFFYQQPAPADDCTSRECRLCHDLIKGHWWAHILSPCSALSEVIDDTEWQAFCQLLQLGHQGLALYACFPLFSVVLPRLAPTVSDDCGGGG